MARKTKGDFKMFKDKVVTFQVVSSKEDVRIKIVKSGEDFTYEESSHGGVYETIKIKLVTSEEDIKLKKVTSGGFFKAVIKA
jgi:hypothetical protein